MTLVELQIWFSIISSIIAFIGVPVLVYKIFSDPDKKVDKDLTVFNANCISKHNRLDEIIKEVKDNIKSINYTFRHFKENEFRHIEEEMRRMSDIQTEIMTIFREREKNK